MVSAEKPVDLGFSAVAYTAKSGRIVPFVFGGIALGWLAEFGQQTRDQIKEECTV